MNQNRVYRQVPTEMTLDEFKQWFSRLYEDLTGQPATGTDEEWTDRYEHVRDAFAAQSRRAPGDGQ